MTDIGDLNNQIMDSEALKVYYFLRQLRANYYVVFTNCQDLHEFLRNVENRDSFPHMWVVGKADKRYEAMLETTRLLLNFLASACARIESTRNLMRKRYRNKPFFRCYQAKVDQVFKGNDLTEFVEGLRNYSLHYSLPFANARWEFNKEEGIRHFFTLDRDVLLGSGFFEEKNGTPKKGRNYLAQCGKEINIREFTGQYIALIHNFQAWLERELKHMHKEELEWLYGASHESQLELDKLLGS